MTSSKMMSQTFDTQQYRIQSMKDLHSTTRDLSQDRVQQAGGSQTRAQGFYHRVIGSSSKRDFLDGAKLLNPGQARVKHSQRGSSHPVYTKMKASGKASPQIPMAEIGN